MGKRDTFRSLRRKMIVFLHDGKFDRVRRKTVTRYFFILLNLLEDRAIHNSGKEVKNSVQVSSRGE